MFLKEVSYTHQICNYLIKNTIQTIQKIYILEKIFDYCAEILCYIINVFTVTVDQFNASLIYKSSNFFKKILVTPNFWMVAYDNMFKSFKKWHFD